MIPSSFHLKMSRNALNYKSFENFFLKKTNSDNNSRSSQIEIIFALLKIKRKIDQRGLDPLELLQQFKLNDGGDTAVV